MPLTPGQTLGGYRVERLLGQGGMGAVYLGYDTTLQRQVALKVIDESPGDIGSQARILHEARSAAALNHPSICTIYEVGVADGIGFIAMEYVAGRSLDDRLKDGPLPLDEACRCGIQAADALACAHARGVIHRDLKAANVIVSETGQLKIVDFGLARRDHASFLTGTTYESIAPPGAAVGTPYAMAPEQVRGESADERTDLWGLGVLLYEMLTATRPFSAPTVSELFSSILRDAPAPLPASIAPAIASVTERCLTKDPRARIQTAADARLAIETAAASPRVSKRSSPVRLRRLWPAAAVVAIASLALGGWFWYSASPGPPNSVAVLPFANVSGDADTDYLSDGISEGLINSLGRISTLTVMSRNAAFKFKGPEADAQQAGRSLGVRVVAMGRVTRRGDDLSINAELIDVASNQRLWGESFNRKVADLLAVQDEISTEIANALRLRLTGREREALTRRYTDNTTAYQLYLRGRYQWNKKTPDGFNQGIKYFEQAIEADQNYAPAYAGLAALYNNLANYNFGLIPPREAWAKAKSAAERAIQIDDALASAHASLALVYYQWEWDWQAAEREFTRALDLGGDAPTTYEPGPSSTNHWYAHYLMTMGRTQESLAAGRRALALDPVDSANNAHQGWHYLWTREYEQAIGPLRQAIEMDPAFVVNQWYLGMVHEQLGDFTKAIALFEQSARVTASRPSMVALLGHALASGGRRAEAQRVLVDLLTQSKQRYVPPYPIAVIYAALGETDAAFEWLDKAHVSRDSWMNYVALDPRLDRMHADPRFADLLRRMKLPAAR